MHAPKHLVDKYNIAGPRYTSYPTVPYWQEHSFTTAQYLDTLVRSFNESNATDGISLYLHLPFCESLCTFCACNKRITKNHGVETGYINALLAEWRMYVDYLAQHSAQRPRIRELHLGGGTPTFFSPANLALLMDGIFAHADRAEHHEFGFEGHPNNTTPEHLRVLFDAGFRRVSFGVQDYDVRVQTAIHRIQPFEHVARVHEAAREIGYTSISHDLVFGLPHQTIETMRHTISQTAQLSPDRLAFYSYAHVPWLKGNGQRGFDDADLPSGSAKRALYETGKAMFDEMGYVEVGMDHFARPTDTLYMAQAQGRLHRNFMGYTETNTRLMVSLGVSSIADSWYGFAQNEKNLDDYLAKVQANQWPIQRGHILTDVDLIIRTHILNIMCRMKTDWSLASQQFDDLPQTIERLKPMQDDGLLHLSPNGLEVTELGRPFIRNIAMAFDLRLLEKQPDTRLFSMTI
jgi:oxygen-independent coproporphyrinogen-3 oxidase